MTNKSEPVSARSVEEIQADIDRRMRPYGGRLPKTVAELAIFGQLTKELNSARAKKAWRRRRRPKLATSDGVEVPRKRP